MKYVILLGGSGYVGTHLSALWLQQDPEISIISISRRGTPKEIPSSLKDNKRIQWISADVFNIESYISKLPEGSYGIIDLIGTADAKNDALFEKMNVGPVKIMIELMDKLSIKKGCYISGVIGMPGKNKPFISSKKNAENLIKESQKDISIIRPSLVYGDRPEVKAMVPLMKAMGIVKASYKPILVTQLAKEIIEVF